MPIDEIASGFLRAIFRFLGWVLIEVVLEFLIKGLGYIICRPFKKVNPDGIAALLVGILAWIFIIVTAIIVFQFLSKEIDIDSCLDSGGRYNYENSLCEK